MFHHNIIPFFQFYIYLYVYQVGIFLFLSLYSHSSSRSSSIVDPHTLQAHYFNHSLFYTHNTPAHCYIYIKPAPCHESRFRSQEFHGVDSLVLFPFASLLFLLHFPLFLYHSLFLSISLLASIPNFYIHQDLSARVRRFKYYYSSHYYSFHQLSYPDFITISRRRSLAAVSGFAFIHTYLYIYNFFAFIGIVHIAVFIFIHLLILIQKKNYKSTCLV